MNAKQASPLPGEAPWIPPPVAGDLLWPRRTIYGGDAKWSDWRGAHRPCVTCIEVIEDHRREPYPHPPGHPAPATKRRKGPNGDTWHCSAHGADLEAKDREIGAKLATQREHAAHLARSTGRRR